MIHHLLEHASQYVTDGNVASQGVLLKAGTVSINPLIQAIILRLKSFNELTLGKSQLKAHLSEFRKLILDTSANDTLAKSLLSSLEEEFENTSDNPELGLSDAQLYSSIDVLNRARELVTKIGEPAEIELVKVLQTHNASERCVAILILTDFNNPISKTSAKYLMNIRSYLLSLERDPAAYLALGALALAGDQLSNTHMERIATFYKSSKSEFFSLLPSKAIHFIAHSE